MRGAHPGFGGVVGGEVPISRRQLGITQALGSVGVLGGAQRRADRPLGTLGHRHVGDLAQLQQAQVVPANLLNRNISRGRGDADELRLFAGEQIDQRHRVVDARVDVDEDRYHGRRPLTLHGHPVTIRPRRGRRMPRL